MRSLRRHERAGSEPTSRSLRLTPGTRQERRAPPGPVFNLAAGIAHDVNNMLTGLLGQLTLALDEDRPVAESRQLIREAIHGAYRASELVKHLPVLAAGSCDVRGEWALDELVRETAAFTLCGKDVAFELHVERDLRPALVSRIQIGRVVQNLLLNAAQAMPDGSGSIRVTLRNLELAGEPCVELVVKDDGEGIAEVDLERVFRPRFTTRRCGSGLGLATSRSIVEAHGGTVRVHSRRGAGTRFTILLPAAPGAREA